MSDLFRVRRVAGEPVVRLGLRVFPGGPFVEWDLTHEGADEIAECLQDGHVAGDAKGPAGSFSVFVEPTGGASPPEVTLHLGLGKNAAEMAWSLSPKVVADLAVALTTTTLPKNWGPYLPPCCPDCGSKMVYVTCDMTEQGGPPEETWLCSKYGCGRALQTYEPTDDDKVCIP